MKTKHHPIPKKITGTKMKLIYIAGPFRASNSWEMEQNIRRAETLALEVWRSGAAALCPHANTRFYQGAAPDEVWLKGDLLMLSKCDALMLVEGWSISIGTRAEIAFAFDNGIPVFSEINWLKRWIAGEGSRSMDRGDCL